MTTDPKADGWAQHAAEQARAWLDLTPIQRLRWLDDAKRFASKYGRQQAAREDSDPGPAAGSNETSSST